MTITNKEDALRAVKGRGMRLVDCSTKLKAYREVVLAAVSQNGRALEYASDELQADRELVLVAVSNRGCAIEYASKALRNDREVVLVAVSQDGGALQYADEALQLDPLFLKAAIETNPKCTEYIQNPHRQRLYNLVSPLSIVSFHCGEAAQDKLTGVITGLMTLSYHSPLRALAGSNERPHSRKDFTWNHDVSLSILGYLSVNDIARLMQTPANVYVKASDGSERPCHQERIDGFFFNTRISEDEANKECYLTSEDFKVLR